jgi:hypothetical protein
MWRIQIILTREKTAIFAAAGRLFPLETSDETSDRNDGHVWQFHSAAGN